MSNIGDAYNGSGDPTAGKIDALQFKAGVAVIDVTLSRTGDSLIVKINGTTDQVTVSNYFINDGGSTQGYAVEQIRFDDGTTWNVATVKEKTLLGTGANDTLIAYASADVLNGNAGNDTLYGRAGNDVWYGGDGADGLYGEGDADTLDGGAGNDALSGGTGSNLYLFGRGSGADTVANQLDNTAGKINTLRLGPDITPDQIELRPRYSSFWSWDADLEIAIVGTADKITFGAGWRGVTGSNDYATLQRIEFADGTVWDFAAMQQRVFAGTPGADTYSGTTAADTLFGLAGADVIRGSSGDDVIDGGADNDTLWGDDGADTLLGGAGVDTLNGGTGHDTLIGGDGGDALYGDAGNDTLDGGVGNDGLVGGAGNNVYLFSRGGGADVVSNQLDNTTGKINTLRLGPDITPDQIELRPRYSSFWTWDADLEIAIVGTADKITFGAGWRGVLGSNDYATLQRIEFADGTVWDMAAIQQKVFSGTSGADTLTGTSAGDTISGQAGNDSLNGGTGNDTLNGGEGADTLIGGTGNDTFVVGRGFGADLLQDNDATAGNSDTLQFMAGIASDQIWLRKVGNDLEASIIGTADKFTVQSWYSGSAYHVEQFKTSDGKTLLDSQVQNLVDAMAGFAPPAMGQTTLPENYQASLAPTIASSWGS